MSFAFAEIFCHPCVTNVLRTFGVVEVNAVSDFIQPVGTTRSSKAIRQPVKVDETTLAELTGDYGPDDHFDAYALFEFLLSRELASIGVNSPRAELYENISYFHREAMSKDEMERQKKELGIATIFDVINFGHGRCHPFFVNERPPGIK